MPGGIFGIENWSEELRARDSVRPLLAVLEQHGDARVIQQRVATPPEVGYYLHRFSELKNYAVGYLATGPNAGSMQLASDPVSFQTLLSWSVQGPAAAPDTDAHSDDTAATAERAGSGQPAAGSEELLRRGKLLDLSGKVMVLAGASSLRGTPAQLRELQQASGAVAICGYASEIPWVEAAGFELMLLAALAEATSGRRQSVPAAIQRMWRASGQLMDNLGFISAPNYDPAAENGI